MREMYSDVVLKVPLPSNGLVAGDRGVVVHVHGNGEAYEVEFMTSAGETIAVVTATADQLTQSDAQVNGASDAQA